MELGTGDTQIPSAKGMPHNPCPNDKQQPFHVEANQDAQDKARKLAPGQTNAMDSKENPEPGPSMLLRFQLLPAKIRQKIYNYVWFEDWFGGQRITIELVPRDLPYLEGWPPNIMDLKDGVSKPWYPERNPLKPAPAYKLARRQLVRDLDPHLTRRLFELEDKTGHQQVTVEDRDIEIDDIEEYEEKVKDEDDGETFPLSTSLLFTCKSIYKETLLQFYARKVFVFASAGSAQLFLDAVSPPAKAAIRHIELRHLTAPGIWLFINQYEVGEACDEAWNLVCKRMPWLKSLPRYILSKSTNSLMRKKPAYMLMNPGPHHTCTSAHPCTEATCAVS